jgi:hypothetical protein
MILFLPVSIKSQTITQIRGRAISSKGQFVSKATAMIVYPRCKDCTEDVVEVFETEDDGTFFLNVDGSRSIKVHIFIEEKKPDGYWIPIYSPGFQLAYLPEFRGTPLDIQQSKNPIVLDSTPLTIKYVKFNLNLPEILGRIKNLTVKEISPIAIQIRHSSGQIVDEKSDIPKEFWEANSKTLKLALPKGVWILDVFFQTELNTIYMKSIEIKAITDNMVEVISQF